MPPKPRSARKSVSVPRAPQVFDPNKAVKDATAMPPPADPVPPPLILEPEIDALLKCLTSAMVKTGQICQFYSDSCKLGIHRHAPYPPQSLMASLGREVEKYDQLCDAMESHVMQAISALQRDVEVEEQRIRDERTAAVANRTRSKSMSMSPTSTTRPQLPPTTGALDSIGDGSSARLFSGTQATPPLPSTPSMPPTRRPSAISLSSLHRPPFLHKLDLSSVAHRIPDEASIFSSGLASPVSLAPKSARPSSSSDFPPDLLAAFANAEATSQTDGMHLLDSSSSHGVDLSYSDMDIVEMSLDPSLGSSADKPIVLDPESLDISQMSDLFGDAPGSNDSDATAGLFIHPPPPSGMSMLTTSEDGPRVKQESLQIEMLDAFTDGAEDLFGSLGAHSPSNGQNTITSQHMSAPSEGDQLTLASPSPGSILASFVAGQDVQSRDALSDGVTSFDITGLDMPLSPDFFGDNQSSGVNMMDMAEWLTMGEENQPSSSIDFSK